MADTLTPRPRGRTMLVLLGVLLLGVVACRSRAHDDAVVGIGEHGVEGGGELGISVAVQEPKLRGAVAEVHQQVADGDTLTTVPPPDLETSTRSLCRSDGLRGARPVRTVTSWPVG